MDIYITVDTEVWPKSEGLTADGLDAYIAEDVYGATDRGEFGIGYQMDVLESNGLRGVFFVESLFAIATGRAHLSRIVKFIQDRGHEVQLHVHPEWLRLGVGGLLPQHRGGQYLKDFSLEEQIVLIGAALDELRASGASHVCAFRAGNCGANRDTLRALEFHQIPYDSSYNVWYLNSVCDLKMERLLVQPTMIEGVEEFPIAFFRDWPKHYRHVQIGACSTDEIQTALMGAYEKGWQSFVILSHSFELLKGRHTLPRRVSPDYCVVQRFADVCRFIGQNRDRFRSAVFAERATQETSLPKMNIPLSSTMTRTGKRYIEQLSRRFY